MALGRALVKEPDILLFDEPLSNLDARLRLTMRGEIKHLQKDLGITSIYVTHDQVEAMTMADRIAVMNGGHLQAFDSPDELYDRPKTLFVAGFVGNPPMNFLNVEVSQSNGGFIAESDSIRLQACRAERGERHPPAMRALWSWASDRKTFKLRMKVMFAGEIFVVEPLGREDLDRCPRRATQLHLAGRIRRANTNPVSGSQLKFDMEQVAILRSANGAVPSLAAVGVRLQRCHAR